MRRRLPILAVCLILAGCGSSSGGNGKPSAVTSTRVVSAKLTGASEVQKGSPTGSGTAEVRLDAKAGKACWTLTITGIGPALSAHVHHGPAGSDGPVVIPLGDKFKTKGCELSTPKAIAAVAANPAAYYVNVHTRKYLNGAIRGQLQAQSGG